MAKAIKRDVLIVGAGHAGTALAASLAAKDFAGSILLAGDDAHPPYERPPLSKAALLSEGDYTPVPLYPHGTAGKGRFELATGCSVVALEPDRKCAALSDGRRVTFDWCVLATGGRARPLVCPGADLPQVRQLRNLDDALALREALHTAERLVIIGGGYIGLEVAASARMLGKEVDVVETQGRVLSRVTSRIVSSYLEDLHRGHGVRFHFGEAVTAIEPDGARAMVVTDKGARLAADLVLVGIGIEAQTALAEAAGIACHNGVLVDSRFRTSASGILAIGDCARHPNVFSEGLCRLESVQHAQDSAAIAAETIMGRAATYSDVPTFWSEQYDLRLQSAGIARDADDVVVRGDMSGRSFCVAYLLEGRLIAIDAINAPREFMMARRLIGEAASVDRSLLADSSVSLKALA
jgi:3-phenylpropionate/trans-cinnamate dioxygenase ferredoxin reductase subunit